MTATRLRSATAKTAKDVHNYRGIEFSDPEQEKINHSWAHVRIYPKLSLRLSI
jgi:hypothetical protein